MSFPISFQCSYVPKSLSLLGLSNIQFNNKSILIQYFLFILSLFSPLSFLEFFLIPFPKLYSNSEKKVKKQPKKARKTVIFEPKKCENRGSVAKFYFNGNGGMRVGGRGFSRSLFWLYKKLSS